MVANDGAGWHAQPGYCLLVVSGMTAAERDGLRGPVDVGVVASGPLVGLVLRPQGWEWIDMPCWRRPGQPVPAYLTTDDASPAGERIALGVIVVDGDTRLVESVRTFSLSPHVTRVLRREVADAWASECPDGAALQALSAWQAVHPRPQDVVRAMLARCKAGS